MSNWSSPQRPPGLPEGAALYDLTFWHPGLWHMHGTEQRFVYPYGRMRECVEAAEKASRGCKYLILRIYNRSDEGYR